MKYIYLSIAAAMLTSMLAACSSNPQQRSGSNSCSSDCRRQYTQADKQKQCLSMCR